MYAPPLPPAAAQVVGPSPLQRPISGNIVPVDAVPYVLTLAHPKVRGFAMLDEQGQMVNDDGKPVGLNPTMPLLQAFGAEHVRDEHMVCYTVEGADGPTTGSVPRMTKGAVAALFDPKDICKYRERLPGIVQVSGTMLALDFDLPEHVRWTDAHRSTVQNLITECGSRWPVMNRPSIFYATNGGLRLVWILSRPVDVRGAGGLEDLLHGLVATAYMSGLLVDPACRDWTRLFRLPRVIREDKQPAEAHTSRQSYFAQSYGRIDFGAKEQAPADGQLLVFDPETFTPLSAMSIEHFEVSAIAKSLGEKWKGRVGKAPRDWSHVIAAIETGDCPDDEQVQRILTGSVGGGAGQSALYRAMITTLRAKAQPRDVTRQVPEAAYAHGILAEEADMRDEVAGKKQLHAGIMRLARSLCYVMQDRLGEDEHSVSPQVVYALVIQPARRANAKHQDEGQKVRDDTALCREVWDVVTWFYTRWRSTVIMRSEEAADDHAAQSAMQATMLEMVGAYRDKIISSVDVWSGGLGAADDRRRSWLEENWQRLAILRVAKNKHLLRVNPTGTIGYGEPAQDVADLVALRAVCNHTLVKFTKLNKDGIEAYRDMPDIAGESMTIARDMRLSRLVPSSCARIRLNNDSAVSVQFVQALPGMSTTIVPAYDPLVDEWLYLLAGGDMNPSGYEELCDWLAAFTQIDKPAPAMYIQADAGVGKGMLALGLRRMTETDVAGKFDDFLSDFQDTLYHSPFIWVDEAVTTKKPTKRVLDTFKMIVTGEANCLNPKGTAATPLEGNWRMLITANHDHAIPWDEEVSGNDLNAVTQRLHHLTSDSIGCKAFLDRIGQREGTDGWPERRIPGHVAYLAQTRQLKKNQRLLTQPKGKEFHDSISISSGHTSSVTGLIGELMLQNSTQRSQAIVIQDGEVYLLPDVTLRALHQNNHRDESIPKSPKKLSQSLKQISIGETSTTKVRLTVAGRVVKPRVWHLDMRKIITWLHKNDCNSDLRPFLEETLWKKFAPPEIYAEYADSPVTVPPMVNAVVPPKAPPKPPPAPPSKVIIFPSKVAVK